MLLSSVTSAARFELHVVDYQFPEISGGREQPQDGGERDWDANWLVVLGTVTDSHGGIWSFREPCLTTWEAADLTDWLDLVAAGQIPPGLTFTEPNLEVRTAFDGQHLVLTVVLSRESWRPGQPDTQEIVLDLTAPAISVAAHQWRQQVLGWPPR